MTSPAAAGQRFIAAGPFLWMSEVAEVLRDRLGEAAAKVPTRTVPNLLVRLMALLDSGLRTVVGELGEKTTYSSAKAEERLGWSPRPVEDTIAETAESMISKGLVKG